MTCSGETPATVVSLDYCADQFTLALVDRGNIAAVSLDADKSYSYMRDSVQDIPQIRASAETVLAFQPTLIVRSYGGGANAKAFYENLGIRVVQLSYANNLSEVQREIIRLAGELDAEERGIALVRDMKERLARLDSRTYKASVMYMTPGGVTSGKHTMMDELITAAGLQNFEQRSGWQALPLEALTFRQPEIVAQAFYGGSQQHYWSAARHDVLKQALANAKNIKLEDATTACGGWFLLDAIEALADGAES